MMLYYCLQGHRYQAKNRLQTAAQKALAPFDGILISEPSDFYSLLTEIIADLNGEFPKCTPLEARKHQSDNTLTCYVRDSKMLESHLIGFTLHPIRGKLSRKAGQIELEIISETLIELQP